MSQTLSPDVSGAPLRAPPSPPLANRVLQLRERVEELVRREPAKAIVIAAVAGLITGRLIRLLAQRTPGREEGDEDLER